ncbi:MAG: dTDP-3-amino-3,4,6-trideoxy-alpha-D-glucopyranose [Candidatus Heimdallarchaeota archaeon LC_2]|nr:MAG: dTDP-3-amino-3,4,6-trideoxy-alpha-D-glucopyranose [Candidatus Heimdallarchaeota archaeon LC_2]
MDEFNIYGNDFSKVYHRFWYDFIDKIGLKISNIHQIYNNSPINKMKVLDLFCGTGRLIKILSNQGYHVTGLDKSANMLEVARKNLETEIKENRITLIKDLAEEFNLNTNFELIVSTFDSINHLDNLELVRSCFSSVYQHLTESGVFIFDMNTKDELKKWNFIDLEESDDKSIIFIMHGKYVIGEDKAYTRVTGFIDDNHDGSYKRFDEIMYNSLFNVSDILKIISDVGFSECILYSEDLENIIEKEIVHKDRVFIVAIKNKKFTRMG